VGAKRPDENCESDVDSFGDTPPDVSQVPCG